MSKEQGTKVLLKIGDSDSPTNFTSLAGQRDTRMQMQSDQIDVSDKTTDNWGSSLQGTTNMTVTCSGVANWPDTNGLDAIRSSFENNTVIEAKVVLNNAGANYTGFFAITQLDIGGSHDGATEYSLTLVNSGAPVYAAT